MRSHFRPTPGAAVCAVAGAALMLNARASAQTPIAADYATNATYAAGWSDGQNGGYGFGPWSFYGTGASPVQQRMTYGNSSPFDALGTAWTLFNPNGSPDGTDLANAGRSCSPMQVGQTFETVIDNPNQTYFYRGYTISLLNNTNNNPGGVKTGEQVAAYTFEYHSNGRWYVGDESGNTPTPLFNTDTAPNGMKLDITLTSPTTYYLTMTPLSNPANAYSQTGTLKDAGQSINWIQFTFYNTEEFTNVDSDFYISSMTITPGPVLDIAVAAPNVILTWPGWASSYNLQSATNLGPLAVWSPVSTSPVMVNGQNVVTNPIVGAHQYFRLQQ